MPSAMSGFAVPFSSSPPSTPESRSRTANGHSSNSKSFMSNPSTTPAGPPPSSAPSFTPAGPPPTSLFRSSQPSHRHHNRQFFNSNKSLFPSSIPATSSDDEDMIEDDGGSEESQEYSEGSEEGDMSLDGLANDRSPYAASTPGSRRQTSASSAGDFDGGFDVQEYGSSFLDETPRGIKRSRGGATISHDPSRRTARESRPKKDSPIPAIVKDMAIQMGLPMVIEPRDFLRETEDLVSQLYVLPSGESSELAIEGAIATVVEELSQKWESWYRRDLRNDDHMGSGKGVLPDESKPTYHKATFLANLLMQLHHPPPAKGMQALAVSHINRKDPFALHSSQRQYKPTAMPQVLLGWLNRNHRPYDAMMETIFAHDPDPTAHTGYWDMILSMTIRGKMSEVINLLNKSKFQYALTARDDGQSRIGYEGSMLENVDRVVKKAVQVLETCPALSEGDWDTMATDWVLFRKRVGQAMNDLETFAEGRDREMEPGISTFEAANFGITLPDAKLSSSARKAGSQVPWSVYQSVKIMYGILLGETTEIISSAQDWIEATIGLTAWWDGEEDESILVGSLAMTRRSLKRSKTKGSRLVDINPIEAYLRRLAYAFERITDDEKEDLFQISSVNPVEVGLASIFEGNVEGVIALLRAWSLPVASAVAEIASLGRWYNPAPSTGMMDAFDESDLLVLSSYGPRETTTSLDSILVDYAEKLADIGFLGERVDGKETPEGWQLSIQLFSRLQDTRTADKKLLSLVQRLPLESEERVDKLVRTCKVFGIETEGLKIAERYADSIAENTEKYGTALMYYARAHSHKKVKKVFDLLISLSVVHSMAFPPLASLDDRLKGLISQPEINLGIVAYHDQEAARLLHLYLTGYATLRRFYDLRDDEHNIKQGEKPQLRPLARKKAAATALVAVISSAADNIFGGLYDESRDAVVHVDVLLALLGEAMVFVNQQKPMLSRAQTLALLSAIESLETVSPKIYAQCENCYIATLSSYHSSQSLPNPQDMMRKTVSSLTSSSGFSLAGSELLGESMTSGGGSGSMVKIGGRRDRKEDKEADVRRGWDWRRGVKSNARGADVLRILRLGLAQDLAKGWIEGS